MSIPLVRARCTASLIFTARAPQRDVAPVHQCRSHMSTTISAVLLAGNDRVSSWTRHRLYPSSFDSTRRRSVKVSLSAAILAPE